MLSSFLNILSAVEWLQLIPTYSDFCQKKKSNEDNIRKESELDVPTEIDFVSFDNGFGRL